MENDDDSDILAKINVKGKKADYITVTFEKGKIKETGFCINSYNIEYDGKKAQKSENNYCEGANVKNINILNTETSLEVGSTLQLNVEIESTGEYGNILYTSFNPEIATVNSDGLITGIAGGKVEIKIKAGYKTSYITLIVSKVPVSFKDDDWETSETSCGFVVEFVDVIAQYSANNTRTSKSGYPASLMRKYIKDT